MQPTRVDRVPIGDRWLYETKFDGVRCLAYINDRTVMLHSRTGTNMTEWFPELERIAEGIAADNVVLDGEIILGDGSVESFNSLLSRTRARRRKPSDKAVTYVVFDILALRAQPTIDRPLEERRRLLRDLICESELMLVSAAYVDGVALLQAVYDHGREGIVAKIRTSAYESGRTRHWLKIKIPGAIARHRWHHR